MTTDELIDLVVERDRRHQEWREADAKLKESRVKAGFYIGNNGRCVQVIEHADHPSDFRTVSLNTVLRYQP